MEPVGDGKWSEVDVPVCACWSIDENRANDTIRILQREMTVIPSMAVTCRSERIGKGLAGSDRTLGDSWNTIVGVVVLLMDSVPVDCCPDLSTDLEL